MRGKALHVEEKASAKAQCPDRAQLDPEMARTRGCPEGRLYVRGGVSDTRPEDLGRGCGRRRRSQRKKSETRRTPNGCQRLPGYC